MGNEHLRAWHGDADLKARIMAQLDHHIALDQMVQRVYAEGDPYSDEFRGCGEASAVGI